MDIWLDTIDNDHMNGKAWFYYDLFIYCTIGTININLAVYKYRILKLKLQIILILPSINLTLDLNLS